MFGGGLFAALEVFLHRLDAFEAGDGGGGLLQEVGVGIGRFQRLVGGESAGGFFGQVEMQMGQGGAPVVQAALDHAIRPSLSVDTETAAPNDLFTQMRAVFAVQRLGVFQQRLAGAARPPALLGARDVLEFATMEGARANGLERRIGSLTPGKQADMVLLDRNRINVMPAADPVGAIVTGMDTGNVDSVYVAGRAVKRGGRLLGVDLPRLRGEAQAVQARIAAERG